MVLKTVEKIDALLTKESLSVEESETLETLIAEAGWTLPTADDEAAAALLEEASVRETELTEKMSSLETYNAELTQTITDLTEKLEASFKLEDDAIFSFCAANRGVVSFSEESELVKNGASLQDVMAFAQEKMEAENTVILNANHGEDADSAIEQRKSIIQTILQGANNG